MVVDLGGVAAAYRPERRLAQLVAETGLIAERITAALFDSGLDHRAERGDFTPDEAVGRVLGALDGKLDVGSLVAAWSRCFEPDESVLQVIAGRRERTGLFTNNGPIVDLCLAGPLAGLAAPFDHLICSWHLEVCKPDRAAFERAAEHLDADPGELLLLDDSLANVEAARSTGWHAALITDAADVDRALSSLP